MQGRTLERVALELRGTRTMNIEGVANPKPVRPVQLVCAVVALQVAEWYNASVEGARERRGGQHGAAEYGRGWKSSAKRR